MFSVHTFFRRDAMPIYISRGRFTSEAIKGMLAKPENRQEAVAKLFQSVGGKLIGWYLTFGRHDWLAIGEFGAVGRELPKKSCIVVFVSQDGRSMPRPKDIKRLIRS
jgi:hypothetical protein